MILQPVRVSAPRLPSLSRSVPNVRRNVVVAATGLASRVRPYTLRKGDTLQSISSKRGMTTDQLLGMNPDLNPDSVKEGITILLPGDKLSVRDKEILDGIGQGYRLYPVRAGETVTEILGKRCITKDEVLALNPGLDLAKVKENDFLKLPANKFTVREREMLIGSGIVPPEFFQAAKNPFVIGFSFLMLVCGFVLAWQRFYKDEDEDYGK